MAVIQVTTRSGETSAFNVSAGESLMDTLRSNGFDELLGLCGGHCSCATCHVYIAPAFLERLGPLSADEEALLGGSDWRRETSRLSCQIKISEDLDGLDLTIAPED